MRFTLGRIILYVENINELKKFYCSHFGFEPLNEIPNEWVALNCGTIEIGLHRIGKEYRDDVNKQELTTIKNSKFVFYIDEDIVKLHREMSESEISVGEIQHYDSINEMVFDGVDPEGNVFQIAKIIDF